MTGRRAIAVGSSSRFDQRRNSSRVSPVLHGALEAALSALERLRRNEPELCRWIIDGHPRLTELEHVDRFGAPYKKPAKKKAAD